MVLFNFKRDGAKEGDPVPSVKLRDEDDKIIDTATFKGQWYVLYFYPKDNSPGCTWQAKHFTDMLEAFHNENASVIGISADSTKNHRQFRDKQSIKHKLLSDPEGKLAVQFGVRLFLGFCSRDTIIINPYGKVDKIYRSVSPKNNAGNILDYIREQNAKG